MCEPGGRDGGYQESEPTVGQLAPALPGILVQEGRVEAGQMIESTHTTKLQYVRICTLVW